MTTITWPARLAVVVGATLVTAVLTLAFAGPHAGAAPAAGGAKTPAPVPGDNGTVKIHNSTTPVTDPRNEPHVCVFYLDAFGFDPGQSVSWQIKSWPPTGDRSVVSSGALALDGGGAGFTSDMTLPDGHYKLLWNFTGENGLAKQKVFWVGCAPTPSPTPTPSGSPSGCSWGCPSGSPSGCPPSSPSGCPTGSPSGTPSSSPSGCPCSPSPSPSPTPTSTGTHGPRHPSPGPSSSPPSGGGLPITGWPLALIAAVGVGLLGTGGTAMVAARRRRG